MPRMFFVRQTIARSVRIAFAVAFGAAVLTFNARAADPSEYKPPAGGVYVMEQHFIWCGEPKTAPQRLKRYEKFWAQHRPDTADGYDDSRHIRTVRRCAYRLAQLYAEVGRKNDCLKMLKWLEKEDDTLDIIQD